MTEGTYTIEIQGLDRLMEAFNRAPGIVEPRLQAAIVASQQVLAKNRSGIVPQRTDRLITSFHTNIERLRATYFPTVKYAIWVHEGTGIYGPENRPITIFPKEKKALFWPGAAHPVKSVTQNGIRPNRFMPKLAAAAQPEIDQLFQKALDLIVQDLATK